jgi:hypothetical protein
MSHARSRTVILREVVSNSNMARRGIELFPSDQNLVCGFEHPCDNPISQGDGGWNERNAGQHWRAGIFLHNNREDGGRWRRMRAHLLLHRTGWNVDTATDSCDACRIAHGRSAKGGPSRSGSICGSEGGGVGSLSRLHCWGHKLGEIRTEQRGWNTGVLDDARKNGFVDLARAGFPSRNRHSGNGQGFAQRLLALATIAGSKFGERMRHSALLNQYGRKRKPLREFFLPFWDNDFNRAGR